MFRTIFKGLGVAFLVVGLILGGFVVLCFSVFS